MQVMKPNNKMNTRTQHAEWDFISPSNNTLWSLSPLVQHLAVSLLKLLIPSKPVLPLIFQNGDTSHSVESPSQKFFPPLHTQSPSFFQPPPPFPLVSVPRSHRHFSLNSVPYFFIGTICSHSFFLEGLLISLLKVNSLPYSLIEKKLLFRLCKIRPNWSHSSDFSNLILCIFAFQWH